MIDIVMATYNGEKYIRQQLLSLIAQTYTDWRCIIHDDGSSDETVTIIKEFAASDKRIQLIEDEILLQSAAQNFLHTLQYSESDFICFCDQDDIWFDNKLWILLSTVNKKNNSIPQVAFSNSFVYEYPSNDVTGKATLTYPKKLKDFLFLNCGIQGAAAIFNKKMKDILLKKLDFLVMHDYYLTIAGICLGEIDYIDECLMLYRNHEKNVTGKTDTSLMYKIKNSFLRRNNPIVSKEHLLTAKMFYDQWNNSLRKADIQLFKDYFAMEKMPFIQRLLFICKDRFSIYESTFLLFVKIFLRKYI